jgi:hypothetical protein
MGNQLPPLQLGSARMPTQITAGLNHNCVLLKNQVNNDTYIKCWGANYVGQLGLGRNRSEKHTIGGAPDEMGDFLPFVFVGARN